MTAEQPLASTFYLDESGNSGDLARPGAAMDFGGQQIFTLACIGTREPEALTKELERLRHTNRVQASELKSSALKGKPALMRDLIAYLARESLPLFVEVVDKRFMIAANLINTLILPPVGAYDVSPQAQWFRNVLAEYTHAHAPPAVIATYVAACDNPSAASVRAAFDAVLDWAAGAIDESDQVGGALAFFARDSLNDFIEAGPEIEAAQRRCLPLPDVGTKGQSIWMLPNLTSLTNIHARINHYRKRNLADVTIFHDEQAHFDAILAEAKALAERLAAEGQAMPARFADYHFTERAELRFARSADTPGIQAADVVAGFLMRHVKSILYEDRTPDDLSMEVFGSLVDLTDPGVGSGINFVLAGRDMARLGLRAV